MQGYRRTRIRIEEKSRNASGFFHFFVIACLAVSAVSFLAYRHVASFGRTVVPKTAFSITKGETSASVPKKLKLETGWRAKLYLRYFAPKTVVQVGTYKISEEGVTLEEVFTEVLAHPDTNDITITFLPGWTVFDIDAYLTGMGVVEKGAISS
ncbi:MAG: Endolytic murein transglycosylase, partial [Patescibacteria group bacterium]|nr:Endolytic murein transglycosylase [Patescibacteria group bacterium]